MNDTPVSPLLDALPLAAVLIGTNERIGGANARARRLLGEAIVGRHFITVLRQPTLLDAIEGTLRDRRTRTTRYLTSEGAHDLTFDVQCAHVTSELGTGVLVCFEDVTQMERAGQMRRDFVANVSHELRTPLTALLGFIETLRGPARNDPAAQERFLSIMEAEAIRMNRLVADLLSLSRVESQERVRPTERVDLRDVVLSVQASLAPLARENGVTLSCEEYEGRTAVMGDEDQLRQVFTNLIENAIKYSGPGARVQVMLSHSDYEPALRCPGVRASVIDSGPGLDPIHIPRLTERFYRVDSHRSREMGGTGLGLAIVKHIVNRHRGRLKIDSAPGTGSSFTVILPAY